MTTERFHQLNLDDRIAALQGAVLLDKKEKIDSTVFIYNLDDVYVEAHRHKPYHYIDAVTIVEEIAVLDTYRNKKKISACSAAYNKLAARAVLLFASVADLSMALANREPVL